MKEPDIPEMPFNPVSVRRRHDGWTAQRQEAFLKALAACGCVTEACAAVGMSRQSAYDLYDRPSAMDFRRAWEAALDCAIRKIEDGAVSRAMKGVARPIFYKGELVGEYRHFDERLTMFLLRYRRQQRYCEPSQRWVPPPLPGAENDPPDPDEPIGSLEYYLDELVDEDDLPWADCEASRAYDGVNFVNFHANPGGNCAASDGDCAGDSSGPTLERGP